MKPILEQIHLGGQKTITGFRYIKKNFETPWHFHPQHELTYIEESVGTKFIGDYIGYYEPGELVLLHSNLPHCWRNDTQQIEQAKSVVVQWNNGILPEIPELTNILEMLRAASKGIYFDKTDSAALIPLLKTFPDLQGQDLYLMLLTILAQLSKCSYKTLSKASFTDNISSEYGSRMVKIHDFVAENFSRKIYLKELADLVNMSEQSFSRFFTKIMKRPFFTFLNEYRINMAAKMLLDTDDTVTQIGFSCGYESPPFFFRKFNKVHGESPMKYRQRFSVKSLEEK